MTEPTLMKLLGAEQLPKLWELDHDSLFMLQIHEDESVSVTTLFDGKSKAKKFAHLG